MAFCILWWNVFGIGTTGLSNDETTPSTYLCRCTVYVTFAILLKIDQYFICLLIHTTHILPPLNCY
jgi:hypothetical protein